jgi:nicotinamide-nucleotide amidase
MELDRQIEEAVKNLANALRARNWMVCTAESCTGGWLAKCCTDLEGSSDWFHGGYVSYSYPAKVEQLDVIRDDLEVHGAVSEEIAAQMAMGGRRRSGADIAVSATGIAGPGGGMPHKPVGMVCFGWSVKGGRIATDTRQFEGNREAVRLQTVLFALQGVVDQLPDLG